MRSLSKLCAVLLITLTVSPVTAPFAVCDLSAIASEDGHTTTESKLLKEASTVATFVESPSAFVDGSVLLAAVLARGAGTRPIAPTNLRL
jgi:hypothetical protein